MSRSLFDDIESHRARRADHPPAGRVEVVGIEVDHLLFGDLSNLRHRDAADRVALARGLRALLDPGRLFEDVGSRRGLGNEGEAAIAIGGDHQRDRHAGLEVLGLRVERLAEFHDVEAALTERRADRRRRVGLAGRHLQLDHSDDFFCHPLFSPTPAKAGAHAAAASPVDPWIPAFAGMLARLRRAHTFSTCEYSSSTGVARPKIDTATLIRDFSSSTSSTTPLNEVNGPSETRTCSPTSKMIDGFGRSIPSWTWRMIRAASFSLIGVGRPRPPRKPVTLAVFLTRCQVSSLRSILIST